MNSPPILRTPSDPVKPTGSGEGDSSERVWGRIAGSDVCGIPSALSEAVSCGRQFSGCLE